MGDKRGTTKLAFGIIKAAEKRDRSDEGIFHSCKAVLSFVREAIHRCALLLW